MISKFCCQSPVQCPGIVSGYKLDHTIISPKQNKTFCHARQSRSFTNYEIFGMEQVGVIATALVVQPLTALIADQMASLRERGILCTAYYSSYNRSSEKEKGQSFLHTYRSLMVKFTNKFKRQLCKLWVISCLSFSFILIIYPS